MRFLLALIAAVTLTACADATSPLASKDANDLRKPVCPVLVKADTILGDTNNIVRYYQFPGENILYFVGPFGYPQNIPPCR